METPQAPTRWAPSPLSSVVWVAGTESLATDRDKERLMHRRRVRFEWQDQTGGAAPARFIRIGRQEDKRHSSTGQLDEYRWRQAVESLGEQAGVNSFAPNALQ